MSDIELWRLIQNEDHGAFNELYVRYWEKLMAIALQRVKDAHAAQDIMQEVFINIWKGRKNLQILKPENYLATSVKYLSLSYLQHGKKMQIVEEDDIVVDMHDMITGEHQLMAKHLLATIHREINTLPPARQLIFRYSRLDGYTIKEIAEKMDLSPLTVKNQLSKALTHFRNVLKMLFLWFIF